MLFEAASLFLLLLFLFYASQRVRYLLKHVAFLACVLTISFWGTVYCILFVRRPDANNHLVFQWMVLKLRVAGALGISYALDGAEILQKTTAGPHILVSNHQSSLDVLGMFTIWPNNTVSMAKKSLQYIPMFGSGAKLCKTVFIDRLNRDKAREVMDDAVATIKREKTSVWVFPEGTRNRESDLLPFKKGAFHLAVQAQIPIIPVVFSPYSFYDKKQMKFDTGTVKITVLEPVPTAGLTADDVADLSVRVRDLMLAVLKEGDQSAGDAGKLD